jgi:hypothetical protein
MIYVCLNVLIFGMQFVNNCGKGWIPLPLFEIVDGHKHDVKGGLCFLFVAW